MTRILIVDDEMLMRQGLSLMLDGADGIEVIGEAANGKEALDFIAKESPDVVLMDIRMPVMDGLEAVETLAQRQPTANRTPVVMLTAFDTQEFVMRALRAGAVGFLLKTTPPQGLVNAVKAAATGQQMLSPEVLTQLIKQQEQAESTTQHPEPKVHPGLATLSEREREVADMIAEGLGNAEIAARAFISPTTVKTHVKHIMEKLDVPSRIHIAIAVLEGR